MLRCQRNLRRAGAPRQRSPGAILRSKPVVPAGAAVPIYGFRPELQRAPSADRAQRCGEHAADFLSQARARRWLRQYDLARRLGVNQSDTRAADRERVVRRAEGILVVPVLGGPESPSDKLDQRPLAGL